MEHYYLAIDIGASSGRHMLAHMEHGKLVLEEVYRFTNQFLERNGHKIWDIDHIFQEILKGLKACKGRGIVPKSIGIDTWAVDYALLDAEGHRLGSVYAYRDRRTENMDREVYKVIPQELLYERTGIQKATFNTIFQLMSDQKIRKHELEKADCFLMVPDYLNFLLTGVKMQEYTNASTTGLIDAATGNWDLELIDLLGLPKKIFRPLSEPGTVVGALREDIAREIGFQTEVILPATHDTGSAVVSVPSTEPHPLYISSGTWSLLGCELASANTSEKARRLNFTNEGGYEHRIRFLKNIMGLWMIQSVKRELEFKDGRVYSFSELCREAESADIDSLIDVNEERFLSPDSMIQEIRNECQETGQRIPKTAGELARVIYHSLAVSYRDAIRELEELNGESFHGIHIVGGGSNAEYLNRLTAHYTGLPVYAGPSEATALGNIGVQMIQDHAIRDICDFRKLIFDSFQVNPIRA